MSFLWSLMHGFTQIYCGTYLVLRNRLMPCAYLLSRVFGNLRLRLQLRLCFPAVGHSAGDDYDNVTGINNVTTEVPSNQNSQNTQRHFQGYNGGVGYHGDSEQSPISTGTVIARPQATISIVAHCHSDGWNTK